MTCTATESTVAEVDSHLRDPIPKFATKLSVAEVASHLRDPIPKFANESTVAEVDLHLRDPIPKFAIELIMPWPVEEISIPAEQSVASANATTVGDEDDDEVKFWKRPLQQPACLGTRL